MGPPCPQTRPLPGQVLTHARPAHVVCRVDVHRGVSCSPASSFTPQGSDDQCPTPQLWGTPAPWRSEQSLPGFIVFLLCTLIRRPPSPQHQQEALGETPPSSLLPLECHRPLSTPCPGRRPSLPSVLHSCAADEGAPWHGFPWRRPSPQTVLPSCPAVPPSRSGG